MIETANGTILKERETGEFNGSGFVPAGELAIAKMITNEQLIEEERSLQKVETEVEDKSHGLSGYLRFFQISRIIAMLSLYLYLDQLDIHQAQQTKQKKERLKRAFRLTRMAVYGEKLYAVRLRFFQKTMFGPSNDQTSHN